MVVDGRQPFNYRPWRLFEKVGAYEYHLYNVCACSVIVRIECFDCRQGLIDQFNEQESIFVFLLSTRAGELMVTVHTSVTEPVYYLY